MKKAGNSRQKNNNQPIYVFTKRDAIQASRFLLTAPGCAGYGAVLFPVINLQKIKKIIFRYFFNQSGC